MRLTKIKYGMFAVVVLCGTSCTTLSETLHKTFNVKTTAYTHNERDHIKYGNKTAIGTRLREGVVATDWSVFPVGTKLRINGYEYVVEDFGSALVGRDVPVVDIYKPSFSAMNKYGAKHLDIEVVEWGCWDTSKELLSKRLRYKHCREMYNRIESREEQT